MSNAKDFMQKIQREYQTEEKVRRLDAADIVEWIHLLEDRIEELELLVPEAFEEGRRGYSWEESEVKEARDSATP